MFLDTACVFKEGIASNCEIHGDIRLGIVSFFLGREWVNSHSHNCLLPQYGEHLPSINGRCCNDDYRLDEGMSRDILFYFIFYSFSILSILCRFYKDLSIHGRLISRKNTRVAMLYGKITNTTGTTLCIFLLFLWSLLFNLITIHNCVYVSASFVAHSQFTCSTRILVIFMWYSRIFSLIAACLRRLANVWVTICNKIIWNNVSKITIGLLKSRTSMMQTAKTTAQTMPYIQRPANISGKKQSARAITFVGQTSDMT